MFYIIDSKNNYEERSMVKKLLIAFLALLLVGCSSNAKPTVEKAFIFSTSNVLSNEDAQEAYDFFEKTLRVFDHSCSSKLIEFCSFKRSIQSWNSS